MTETKTAIVTGASQGIGAGLAARFLEKGYNMVGNSRTISASAQIARAAPGLGRAVSSRPRPLLGKSGLCPEQSCWSWKLQPRGRSFQLRQATFWGTPRMTDYK
jgi:NAD(P)-dependent dehydrogenase (short-subunit alcohol dehydrogenase family)